MRRIIQKETTRWCSDCEEYKPHSEFGVNRQRRDGLQVYCSVHKNARARKSNKKYSQLSVEEQKKSKCRSLLKMRLRRGMMTKPDTCSRCPSTLNIEGHHEDYDKPYEVTWMCRVCHREHHK